MLDIFNGRKAFYQWDSGQKLTVSHAGICEVHFHHPGHDSALVVKIYELEGQRVADVPNILLQDAGEIIAYIYLCIGDECTVFRKKFEVIPRQKPADYVYTETETKTYKALEDRIKALEQGGASDADIMAAIEKYMQDHPVQIEETDPSVPSWAKEPTPPKYTAQDVGALPADTPIPEPYTLPPATPETLGGMMPGKGLAVDKNGRASVEPEKPMRLINSITLQEPVSTLLIDKAVNGAAFSVKEIYVKIVAPQKIDKNILLTNGLRAIALIAQNAFLDKGYMAGMVFEVKNNCLFMTYQAVTSGIFQGVGNPIVITAYGSSAGFLEYADISAIGMNVLSGGELPAGTEISIYEMGVW